MPDRCRGLRPTFIIAWLRAVWSITRPATPSPPVSTSARFPWPPEKLATRSNATLNGAVETVPAAIIAASMTVDGHEPENPPTDSSEIWRRSGGIGVAVTPKRWMTFPAIRPLLATIVVSGSAAKNTLCSVGSLSQKQSCSLIGSSTRGNARSLVTHDSLDVDYRRPRTVPFLRLRDAPVRPSSSRHKPDHLWTSTLAYAERSYLWSFPDAHREATRQAARSRLKQAPLRPSPDAHQTRARPR